MKKGLIAKMRRNLCSPMKMPQEIYASNLLKEISKRDFEEAKRRKKGGRKD
jgi:hypothetical protein